MPINKELGLAYDGHIGHQGKEMLYYYSMGNKIKSMVSKYFPDFFVNLEKTTEPGKKRGREQQVELVSDNMAKWLGRWVVMAKWVVDGNGEGKWVVNMDEWNKKTKSGEGGWTVEDNEWVARCGLGIDSWWHKDKAVFEAFKIRKKAFISIFTSPEKGIGRKYRHAMICGFILGKDDMREIENFTKELLEDDDF